jgi:DNA-directed RNA polymerase specialized sigma24 family protein
VGALYQLNPTHRDVVMQIYYEGRSIAETAQALRLLLQEVNI